MIRTLFLLFPLLSVSLYAQQPAERLNRGIVAVRQDETKAFISWRLLKEDPPNVGFNVYRVTAGGKPRKLNRTPIMTVTWFADATADFNKQNAWFVRPVVNGKELQDSEQYALLAGSPPQQYITVPLKTPEGYTPNDGSVGDLDGDGEYELVIHMTGRGRDNSHRGMTDEPILQAYELDGTLLWSINLGKNIREGAHYTQFMVYDLDGDGRAEVACKTADGTIDGKGQVIGDPDADHRNEQGYILRGPEYLTVFDGLTGAALHTTDFIPPRHPDTLTPTADELKEIWGDGYGNRCDRFLACIAYLDGKRPSLVMTRGYYTRSVLTAWNFDNGKLTRLWTFDSHDGTPGNLAYAGQGNHNISVADVDGDGRDEIIYGACVIDDNGKGLHSTGLGHGDALHVSDLDPDRPGLEVFDIQERFDDAGMHMRDARTGEILWKKPSVQAGPDGEGPGRGNAFDIDPRYPGAECWVFGGGIRGLYSAKGELITEVTPGSCNFGIWWDGDLLRELLDRNRIMKWSWNTNSLDTLLVDPECTSNNGSKATPVLSADLFGDWREEVIWRTTDNQSLRIYITTIPTEHRIVTLMQDHVYRLGIAWQNVAYNQPPHSSRQP
ncbi:MAG: rhamnogalacturonan lyase [Cyclobacteriaceae bacterium]|nr:rhamnogalacturonan lyase [Cyclobacteriaceae bacterium]